AIGDGGGPRDIRANGVALDDVAHRLTVITDGQAVGWVPGDEVPGSRHRTADQVVSAGENVDAVAAVAEGKGAGGVPADEVPLHHVIVRIEVDPVAAVSGERVAGAGARPTDLIGGPAREVHAGAIAEASRAGDVGADGVALHHVPLARDGDPFCR